MSNAPFPYFGAKGRLAPWIVSLMPHRTYVEPFAGSLSVLLAKPRSPNEIVNDLDGDVVCFWRVLRDQLDELERVCRLTPYARAEFTGARLDEPVDDVERARRFWVRCTQSFAHTAVAATGWSVGTTRGTSSARSTWTQLGRFGPVAERIRTVAVECAPATDVIRRLANSPGTVVYVDPPYDPTTISKGGLRTRNGYRLVLTAAEHRELAQALHDTPATVLLSGYHSSLYDEMYAGWHHVTRRISRPSGNRHGGNRALAVEVVWSNRPLQSTPALWEGTA